MKTRIFYTGFALTGLFFLIYGCTRTTPADAVKTAMEKELIKEKATKILEEYNVPEVVVKEFNKTHSDTIYRQWLVYKTNPEETINVKLPEVYIVKYHIDNQGYREKYSREGKIIETNRSINFTVLPNKASDLIKKGDYKDWELVGDVLELLDNSTGDPVGYVVTVAKAQNKERIFFNDEGDIVKIQELTS
jgi:hypothetical protein